MAVNYIGEDNPSLDKSETPNLSWQWTPALQCQSSMHIIALYFPTSPTFPYLFFIAQNPFVSSPFRVVISVVHCKCFYVEVEIQRHVSRTSGLNPF